MVIRRKDMKVELKEKMRDGEGTVRLIHLLDAGGEKNARMFAEITLNPGCSIGYHQHNSETEYFFIISGTGTVKDEGREIQVEQGDSIITGNGAFHSIKNTGALPLVFHAVIVTYS
jgi:mannose-6-phosphate isomerase-like protein (cupin superfamily)